MSERTFLAVTTDRQITRVEVGLSRDVIRLGSVFLLEMQSFPEPAYLFEITLTSESVWPTNAEVFINGARYVNIMDMYLIPANSSPRLRSQFFVFAEVAARYLERIDPRRNRALAAHLLKRVIAASPGETEVVLLDFGCGTGIAASALLCISAGAERLILHGVDVSQEMLSNMPKDVGGMYRSVSLIGTDEVLPYPDRMFSACVMVYVADYVRSSHTLREISRVLAVDGVLLCNFHKSTEKEIAWFTHGVSEAGLVIQSIEVTELPTTTASTNHLVYAFRKEKAAL